MKYIHIGFGKTGTTYLQNYIFEKISKYENLIYYDKEHPGFNLVRTHSVKLRSKDDISYLNLPDNIFISDETLISWNPQDWENFAEKNLRAFGYNSSIIITLRDPENYFNSLYNEICLQSSKVKKINEFFYYDKSSIVNQDSYSVNINNFSYNKIIEIYKKKFLNVIVIKYEDVENLNFIKLNFKKNANKILDELKYTKHKKINQSYSSYAESIHLFLFNKIYSITYFFIKIKIFKIIIIKIAKKMIKVHFPYLLIEQTLNKINKVDDQYMSKKVVEYLFIYCKIRYFIQKIDLLLPNRRNKRSFSKNVYERIKDLDL